VHGSHRLLDPLNATLAESEMVFDIHAKLATLSDNISMLEGATIRAVQNCTQPSPGDQSIAANGTFELQVSCPSSPQEYVLGCGCEVFPIPDGGTSANGFATHKDSVMDTAPVPSRCRCQWTNLSGATQSVNFCVEAQCIGGDVENVTTP
jgi:hypothetical protein